MPRWLSGKESVCNAGATEDVSSIPGMGRSPREGKGYSLQYSGLENSIELYSPWGCRESDTTEQLSLDFPGGSDGKASAYNEGKLGSIPGSGRSSGEGNGNPLKYSCLENPMYGGVW